MRSGVLLALATLCMSCVVGDIIIEYIRGPSSGLRASSVQQQPLRRLPPPPAVGDAARYARYVVHYSEWTSLGHISHQAATDWYPSSRVFSMADGPVEKSTGVPYIYTSYHDSVPRDLKKDPRCSMTMSLAQTEFCASRGYDPEDPRCPQVILTGVFEIVDNSTSEFEFARNALFTRHPEMKTWPGGHHFFFAKLNIKHVQLVDNIGGSKYPNVTDYFNSPPPMMSTRKPTWRSEVFEEAEEFGSNESNGVKEIQVNMID
uniref:Protein CREG1 n=1 Tax=Lygus hesperus TaxID=30085 RepID=A0A0A9Y239_LYGHE